MVREDLLCFLNDNDQRVVALNEFCLYSATPQVKFSVIAHHFGWSRYMTLVTIDDLNLKVKRYFDEQERALVVDHSQRCIFVNQTVWYQLDKFYAHVLADSPTIHYLADLVGERYRGRQFFVSQAGISERQMRYLIQKCRQLLATMTIKVTKGQKLLGNELAVRHLATTLMVEAPDTIRSCYQLNHKVVLVLKLFKAHYPQATVAQCCHVKQAATVWLMRLSQHHVVEVKPGDDLAINQAEAVTSTLEEMRLVKKLLHRFFPKLTEKQLISETQYAVMRTMWLMSQTFNQQRWAGTTIAKRIQLIKQQRDQVLARAFGDRYTQEISNKISQAVFGRVVAYLLKQSINLPVLPVFQADYPIMTALAKTIVQAIIELEGDSSEGGRAFLFKTYLAVMIGLVLPNMLPKIQISLVYTDDHPLLLALKKILTDRFNGTILIEDQQVVDHSDLIITASGILAEREFGVRCHVVTIDDLPDEAVMRYLTQKIKALRVKKFQIAHFDNGLIWD
jgi:hypothetical protein